MGPAYVGSNDCAAALTRPAELSLAAGQWCEVGTLHPFGVEATEPIMVAGMLSGQDSTGWDTPYQSRAGDPSLFLLVPDRQYRADYPFLITDTYARAFVTVVSDPDAALLLDGQPVDLAGATPVPGTSRVFAHLQLASGVHRLTGNQPFGIIVYAFDDFVSYAFTGGLNLEKE
ncbi:MAG: IgGFc-binding protein [bacterium]